jgi:imidazolonepropionase-like amidohydrolase
MPPHRPCIRHFVAATPVALMLAVGGLADAQAAYSQGEPVPYQDVRPWLKGAPTTDDPRRVPIAPRKDENRVLVLKGGRLFDSVSAKVKEGTVVIRDNRIEAILPPSSTQWPAGAEIIDISGETVLPGLIDMHVHLTYPDSDTPIDEQADEASGALLGARNMEYYIEYGITSVRDLNGVDNAPYVLAEWSAANAIAGPRVFTAGHIITATGGHATERPVRPSHGPDFAWEVDGPDAWRAAVRKTFKQGASVIKIASHFAPDEVQAAVDESHRLGLKITCHCEGIYTEMAVKAGVDMIEHPLPRTDETIALMAKNHVASIPTLQVYQNVINRAGGYYNTTSGRFALTSQSIFDMFKKMKAAGVVMGVGTDTIGDADKMIPNNYINELKWFVKGGYTIDGALQAATLTNAQLLDMGDKLGSLTPGKLADIVVVKGEPDHALDDLRKVDLVIKDGRVWVQGGQLRIPTLQSKAVPALPTDVK